MQGDRYDQVDAYPGIGSDDLCDQPAQGAGHGLTPAKFERVDRFAEGTVVDTGRAGAGEIRPAVPAGNAREDEVRRSAQRPAALLADRWPDEREACAAAGTQGEVTECPADLAGRRKENVNEALEKHHAPQCGTTTGMAL